MEAAGQAEMTPAQRAAAAAEAERTRRASESVQEYIRAHQTRPRGVNIDISANTGQVVETLNRMGFTYVREVRANHDLYQRVLADGTVQSVILTRNFDYRPGTLRSYLTEDITRYGPPHANPSAERKALINEFAEAYHNLGTYQRPPLEAQVQ